MATATFRFHGELSAFLAPQHRGVAFSHACARAATVKHAVESLGVPHTEIGRVLVNGEPATLGRIVRDCDEIEVYPGDPPQSAPGEAPAFVADAHLGGLARMLRMLGFDTFYDNGLPDAQLAELALRERRIVLTRDRELLKRRDVLRGAFVHEKKPERQLREIVQRYALGCHMRPFTLCLNCNLRLEDIDRAAVVSRIPDSIARRYRTFKRCPACGGIFWQGSHWERMQEMLSAALAPDRSIPCGQALPDNPKPGQAR